MAMPASLIVLEWSLHAVENVLAIHAPARRSLTQFVQPMGLTMEILARQNAKVSVFNAKENVPARDAKDALSTTILFVPRTMSLMETDALRIAMTRTLTVKENVPVMKAASAPWFMHRSVERMGKHTAMPVSSRVLEWHRHAVENVHANHAIAQRTTIQFVRRMGSPMGIRVWRNAKVSVSNAMAIVPVRDVSSARPFSFLSAATVM